MKKTIVNLTLISTENVGAPLWRMEELWQVNGGRKQKSGRHSV